MTGKKGTCFDRHSNETEWPWYTAIAPLSWLPAVEQPRRATARRLCATLLFIESPASRSMSVVDQAIENAVGNRRTADLLVPAPRVTAR
jgi:hypothetical protein